MPFPNKERYEAYSEDDEESDHDRGRPRFCVTTPLEGNEEHRHHEQTEHCANPVEFDPFLTCGFLAFNGRQNAVCG